MDKGKYRDNYQEVISMEEYLNKRQRIRESENKKKPGKGRQKSPVWMLAELYV